MIWPLLIWATLRQAYAQWVSAFEPSDSLLPDLTEDEQGGFDSLEEDLLENIPPHHG
jgi:hypothetical protein